MPKFNFPRFYIKSVGGAFTIEHRLTHTYIGSVHSEDELKLELKVLNKLGTEEMYRMLIENHGRFPKARTSEVKDHHEDEREKWFTSAWSAYTDKFYTENPKLLVIEEELDWSIISKIRTEENERSKAESQRSHNERIEAEKAYKDDIQEAKLQAKVKEEIEIGKLGSAVSLERQRKVENKGKKKLKVKAKAGKMAVFVDSDDLFA